MAPSQKLFTEKCGGAVCTIFLRVGGRYVFAFRVRMFSSTKTYGSGTRTRTFLWVPYSFRGSREPYNLHTEHGEGAQTGENALLVTGETSSAGETRLLLA